MTNQATTNQDLPTQAQSGDTLPFTKGEAELLIPWLHTTLQGQSKEDHNSDLCQVLGRLLRISNRLYGTQSETRDSCICYG